MSDASGKELTPGQRAATVVVALGSEKASKVYKYLSTEEVERLTLEVAKIGHVEAGKTEAVLDEFYKTCLTQKVVTDGGMEYARSVLEKAYGESTARELLQKVSKYLKTQPFDFMHRSDGKSLYSALQFERPQMIALVLSYAEPQQASETLAEMPLDKKTKVLEAIARMENASPEAIRIVEHQIMQKFNNILTTDFTAVGGVDYVANIMNNMDRSSEKAIFDTMSEHDAELAENIRKRMFVFEDILTMDNRSVQRFIRDCDMKDLVYALKGADEDILSLFFSNMSTRMAETIQADLEITVNVRLSDVEEAQQRIVNLIRKLDEEGELVISKGAGGDIIA